jgi:hypothetical protein
VSCGQFTLPPLLLLLPLPLQLDVAIKLLSAASRNHADAPEVWYYLGTALGKQGGQAGSCCLCFLRTLQLLGPQPDIKVWHCLFKHYITQR